MRRNNPSSSGRGGEDRSHTPIQHPNSWRTITKKGNHSSPSQAFYKGINDLISKDESPEPFTSIVKREVEWTTKSRIDIVIYLEQEDIPLMNDAEKLRQKYLDSAYYPTLSLKSRSWMKTLVIQKGLEITHFWSNDNHSVPPSFSKCIIREVIRPRDWAINPNQELPLVKTQKELYSFNYWDYKEAFYKVFLYQNFKNKHTWLIKLCPEAIHKGLPNWFFDWWQNYGAELKMLPDPIQKLYSSWVESHPIICKLNENEIVEGLCPIYFFAETEIPWIWTWSYETSWIESRLPCLKRKYHIRWWTGINVEEKIKQIEEIISRNNKILENSISQEIQKENPMTKLAKMLRRKYPQASDAEIQQKCLEHMKKQFFEAFDIGDTKSTKSTESAGEDLSLPDAQDPEEDMDTIWEAIMDAPDKKDKGIA